MNNLELSNVYFTVNSNAVSIGIEKNKFPILKTYTNLQHSDFRIHYKQYDGNGKISIKFNREIGTRFYTGKTDTRARAQDVKKTTRNLFSALPLFRVYNATLIISKTGDAILQLPSAKDWKKHIEEAPKIKALSKPAQPAKSKFKSFPKPTQSQELSVPAIPDQTSVEMAPQQKSLILMTIIDEEFCFTVPHQVALKMVESLFKKGYVSAE